MLGAQAVVAVRIAVGAVFRGTGVALVMFAAAHAIFEIPDYNRARQLAASMTAPRPRLLTHFGLALEAGVIGTGLFLVPSFLIRRLVPCAANTCPGCGYDISSNPARCPECGLYALPSNHAS